ncbi:MAG TPA: Rad52/Rad22 family DNA repair protein [Pyrinomonadaceae bacterium]|jgi:hypothetical protein
MAAVVTAEKNSTDRREKRAQSIAAMGLVNRDGDRFRVSTPSLRGRQTSFEVWRDATGKIRCNCLEFEESVTGDAAFRCEHILAVKYSLVAKNTEQVTKQPTAETAEKAEKAEEPVEAEVVSQTATESGVSAPDEQKSDEAQANVTENGQAETQKAEPRSLANTKGKKEMKQEKVKDIPFVTAEEAAEMENNNNVVSGNFPNTLQKLRQHVDPQLVKQREGWRDRNGNTHYVDYVEWHTVADILDETAPNWNHTVKDIRQIGDIFTVTVAITIDGITREGIGTGTADSELGIKKAEHDALKRAAVKFGIARDLYKKESDVIERDGAVSPQTQADGGFPSNPIAKSLGDLVTAKQLGMIRALAREAGVDVEEECQTVLNCKTDELSKKAASSFISHLQDLQRSHDVQINQPLRKVG